MLWAPSQIETFLTGVDQSVSQGRQVHRSNIYITGGLWLSAWMGWVTGRGKSSYHKHIHALVLNKIGSFSPWNYKYNHQHWLELAQGFFYWCAENTNVIVHRVFPYLYTQVEFHSRSGYLGMFLSSNRGCGSFCCTWRKSYCEPIYHKKHDKKSSPSL